METVKLSNEVPDTLSVLVVTYITSLLDGTTLLHPNPGVGTLSELSLARAYGIERLGSVPIWRAEESSGTRKGGYAMYH